MSDIEKINKHVDQNRIYLCWSGMVDKAGKNKFIRADQVFLNLVYRNSQGKVRYRRICPVKYSCDKEPVMVWSTDRAYRVKDGERRGRVVFRKDLKEGEAFVPAGLDKFLTYGNDATCIKKDKKKDMEILDMLEGIEFVEHREDLSTVMPEIYLTCPASNKTLYSRYTADANSFILNMTEKRIQDIGNQSFNTIIRDNCHKVSVDAGEGRVAYPFRFIYGRGVLAVDIEADNMMFGMWYSVDKRMDAVSDTGCSLKLDVLDE